MPKSGSESPENSPGLMEKSGIYAPKRRCYDCIFIHYRLAFCINIQSRVKAFSTFSYEPCALKAQQYGAWDSAPGTQPTYYLRAASAKAVQAECHELAQMAGAKPVLYKSSRRHYFSVVNFGRHFPSHPPLGQQGQAHGALRHMAAALTARTAYEPRAATQTVGRLRDWVLISSLATPRATIRGTH